MKKSFLYVPLIFIAYVLISEYFLTPSKPEGVTKNAVWVSCGRAQHCWADCEKQGKEKYHCTIYSHNSKVFSDGNYKLVFASAAAKKNEENQQEKPKDLPENPKLKFSYYDGKKIEFAYGNMLMQPMGTIDYPKSETSGVKKEFDEAGKQKGEDIKYGEEKTENK